MPKKKIMYTVQTEDGNGIAGPTPDLDYLVDTTTPPAGKEDKYFIYAHNFCGKEKVKIYRWGAILENWIKIVGDK